jgi:hypothetical protein
MAFNPAQFGEDYEITSIREAQMITTSGFPEFIRKAMYAWVNKGWRGFQTSFEPLFNVESNFNDPIITFFERGGMTYIPLQDEGMPAGGMGIATQKLLTFEPVKRTGMISVTEEMVHFDKTKEIMDLGSDFGVAQKRTLEKMAYDLMTCPGGLTTADLNVPSVYQYASASTSTQPWVNGASGYSSLFTGQYLDTVMIAMRRQTDANGNLLGVTPETLTIPLEAEIAVNQVLDSEWLGFLGSTSKDSLTGPPTHNPYQGKIRHENIYTSPFFLPQPGNAAFTSASFPWLVGDIDSGQAWTWLEVEGLTVNHEEPAAAASQWFEAGVIRIRGRIWTAPALRHPRYVYGLFPVQ